MKKQRFEDKPNIYKLGDRPKDFLQVLLPEFTLVKEQSGVSLKVDINEDLDCITDVAGKRDHTETIKEIGKTKGEKLKTDLHNFYNDRNLIAYRFDCSDYPLRYANGGALPVIRLNGEEYFCLFYRDIDPVGWNIANGGSDSLEELFAPQKVLQREFGEELFISDHEKKIMYLNDYTEDNSNLESRSRALEAWKSKFGSDDLSAYKEAALPLKWIYGPDKVSVTFGKKSEVSDGFFLSITPEDQAIEVDRIVLINLNEKVSFFDGEYARGILVNRLVGLFKVKDFENIPDDKTTFIPNVLYVAGEKCEYPINKKTIEQFCLETSRKFRSEEVIAKYKNEKKKFNLCPISRAIIKKYFEWRDKKEDVETINSIGEKKNIEHEADDCEIFISYRSSDQLIADWLCQFLTDRKYKVFFSAKSLPILGEHDYAAAIYRALENAKCLIVIGTNAEHFRSGWVDFEWKSFLSEMLSGRKPKGSLFSFVGGVELNQLPFALRNVQVISFNPSSPQDSFEHLSRYIENALKKQTRE